jgi:predicted TIM-barrel fold metal-dependent hydrolase
MPDDGKLLDMLLEWAPEESDRQRILSDNAAALYAF